MDKISQLLTSIGLSESESAIYLAGLGSDSLGVKELEKQTGIKRTTIYHALNTLQQKGLAAKKGTTTRLLFSMTKPENLERLISRQISNLEQKKNDLNEMIPLLTQSLGCNSSKISVAHYDGIEGIKNVVEEALYAKTRHWDVIAPVKNFFSDFDRAYAKYYIEARRKRKITARTLWEYKRGNEDISKEEQQWRNPRYLPSVMQGKFPSVIILFDDKIVIVSSLKEKTAILIQSPDISATLKAMFEGLWAISTS